MANIYVRSTDGNNVDSGATWALAKLDLAGAAAIEAAGDTIWLSQAHAESTASAISLNLNNSNVSPLRILCGNDGAEPPTALAVTATVTTTGNSGISIAPAASGVIYVEGITFTSGSGASGTADITLHSAGASAARITYRNCAFVLGTTGASSRIVLASNVSATEVILKDCDVKFSAAGQAVAMFGSRAEWEGGSLLSGGTSPTTLLAPTGDILISGLDLTNANAAINLFTVPSVSRLLTIRDSKLPASWSGALTASGNPTHGGRISLYNCDSGDTNYNLWIETSAGSIKDETTLVRTGGASDGTTTISWKLVSLSEMSFPGRPLQTNEIVRWNETTGSSITVTVEILHDSATALKDDEIWLEVLYLGTSGVPLGSYADDAKADVLATAADQTSSSETWTTTGMSNPNKQKLSVTFTPQEKGFIHAVVKLAKSSYTVYVDPKLTVS